MPPPGRLGGGFIYLDWVEDRLASQDSRSDSFQRVQPELRTTGLGKEGSVFDHRQSVDR